MRLALQYRLCIYIAKFYRICLLSWIVNFEQYPQIEIDAQCTMQRLRKAAQSQRRTHLFTASGESSMHELKAAGQSSMHHGIKQCRGPDLQFKAP